MSRQLKFALPNRLKAISLSAFLCAVIPIKPAAARECFQVHGEGENRPFAVNAGDRFDLSANGIPHYLTGEDADSRVNVRSGPGIDYPTDGSYGLVGENVIALGFGYDNNCQIWFQVRFPDSGYEGWIHGDHIGSDYGYGLFD